MALNSCRSIRPRSRCGQGGRRSSLPLGGLLALGLGATLAGRFAAAEVVKLDKPVRVQAVKTDHTRLAGRIDLYDETEFDLLDDKGHSEQVKWSDLPAAQVFDLYAALLPKGTGAQWVEAGKVLQKLPDGKPLAERAYARAVRLDASLKSAVETARSGGDASGTAKPAGGDTGTGGEGPELIKPLSGAPAGPLTLGEAQKQLWGNLSDEHQADAVKQLKTFAEGTTKGKNGSLRLLETKYFLFYSDLKPVEASNWAGLLDRMYARLADLFAVEKGRNIWRGKGLIFVFANQSDYYAFEHDSQGTDAHGTAGMCTSYGNGLVHIAFYRQPNDLDFAHILVHESVHGFIHRYRSAERIPSWANEGLAEVIASELVPQPSRTNATRIDARESMQQRGGVGDNFFSAAHIDAWQYPVAENLCAFMIAQNKQGYVKFINGIKDGMTVEEALEKQYGAPESRLVPAYLSAMGVKARRGK